MAAHQALPSPGILQARTLQWVAISFSNAWKWKVKVKLLSHVWLLATPWTAAYQAPPSMGFPSQEYWSGVPLPSPLTEIIVIYQTCWKAFHWIFVEFYQLSLLRVWVGTAALEGLKTGSGAAGTGWRTRVPTTGRSKLRAGAVVQDFACPPFLQLAWWGPPVSPCHCLTQENILFYYYYYFWPHQRVCGILVSLPGLTPDPWQWKRQVLTTGVLYLVVQLCLTLWNPMDCSPSGTSLHGDSPGLNTGVDSLSLLQGLFPTQVSNLGLPHCRQILYHLSHQESPSILERVAYPFSRGSSRPRNWTGSPALQEDSLPAD